MATTMSSGPARSVSTAPDSFYSTIELELSDIEEYIAASYRDYQTPIPKSTYSHKTKKPGRRPCTYTLLLSQFIPASKMKKDNLRTRLLRAYKRCLRDIRKLQRNTHTSDAASLAMYWPPCFRKKTSDLRPNDHSDDKTHADWQHLISVYLEDSVMFDILSRSGPRNDGKHKQCSQSSYNNDYCQHFFSSELTRRGFAAYVELIFGHKTSSELCERFGVNCCPVLEHSKLCVQLWSQLESLVTSDEFLL